MPASGVNPQEPARKRRRKRSRFTNAQPSDATARPTAVQNGGLAEPASNRADETKRNDEHTSRLSQADRKTEAKNPHVADTRKVAELAPHLPDVTNRPKEHTPRSRQTDRPRESKPAHVAENSKQSPQPKPIARDSERLFERQRSAEKAERSHQSPSHGVGNHRSTVAKQATNAKPDEDERNEGANQTEIAVSPQRYSQVESPKVGMKRAAEASSGRVGTDRTPKRKLTTESSMRTVSKRSKDSDERSVGREANMRRTGRFGNNERTKETEEETAKSKGNSERGPEETMELTTHSALTGEKKASSSSREGSSKLEKCSPTPTITDIEPPDGEVAPRASRSKPPAISVAATAESNALNTGATCQSDRRRASGKTGTVSYTSGAPSAMSDVTATGSNGNFTSRTSGVASVMSDVTPPGNSTKHAESEPTTVMSDLPGTSKVAKISAAGNKMDDNDAMSDEGEISDSGCERQVAMEEEKKEEKKPDRESPSVDPYAAPLKSYESVGEPYEYPQYKKRSSGDAHRDIGKALKVKPYRRSRNPASHPNVPDAGGYMRSRGNRNRTWDNGWNFATRQYQKPNAPAVPVDEGEDVPCDTKTIFLFQLPSALCTNHALRLALSGGGTAPIPVDIKVHVKKGKKLAWARYATVGDAKQGLAHATSSGLRARPHAPADASAIKATQIRAAGGLANTVLIRGAPVSLSEREFEMHLLCSYQRAPLRLRTALVGRPPQRSFWVVYPSATHAAAALRALVDLDRPWTLRCGLVYNVKPVLHDDSGDAESRRRRARLLALGTQDSRGDALRRTGSSVPSRPRQAALRKHVLSTLPPDAHGNLFLPSYAPAKSS